MSADELIDLLLSENCRTYEDFVELQRVAFEAYGNLSEEEQEMVDDSMAMEGLSMVMAAFKEMTDEERHSRDWGKVWS